MSFDYTGSFSGSFYGDITSSNGVISSSAQVSYTQIKNKPTTISAFQKNSIVANSNFRENTHPIVSASFDSRITTLDGRIGTLESSVDETGSDVQQLTLAGQTLSISNGNSVTLPMGGGGGGGSSLWNTGSQDPGSFIYYQTSNNLQLTGSLRVSGGVTGSIDWSNVDNVPSGIVSQSGGIIDLSGVKIQYSNVYTNIGDLPAAADYHGMFAHVHATGKAYYAHGGNWIELALASDITTIPSGTISGSTQITSVITDTYISASAALSGFGTGGGGGAGDIESVVAGLGLSGGATTGDATLTLNTSSNHFRIAVSQSAASYGFGSGGDSAFGDPPVFDQDGLQVIEFVTSGSTLDTLTVTDPTAGDSTTFVAQSGYSDDFFKISTAGVVTANVLMTASMNTSAGSGSNSSHPFLVQVTDSQNNVVEKTIYIYVIPNSAPVFRQTSIGGSVITSFTSSAVNENSADGSTIATIYFTDENSDTITIKTGSVSPAEHFTYTVNSNNVVITQNTASLDYETHTSYTLSLTASDEHYESGDDGNSFTEIEIQIPIGDNLAPGVNNQTLTTINENSANAAVVDSVSATDNESDTITWTSFVLRTAYLNGVGTNVTSSLGGTSLYDPNSNPFQINSGNGQVTRKNGVFLNADIADRYEYEAEVKDVYNVVSSSGIITIPIDDDSVSTIGVDAQDYYIQEGGEAGDNLTTYSNGYTSGNVTFTSAVSQMWEVNTVPSGYVRFTNGANHYTGSSVILEVDTAISGNLHFADSDTVAIQITASETSFETTKQYRSHTLTITDNQPYEIGFSNTSGNLNTNGARPSNTLSTISFTEPQSGIGDTIDHSKFSFVDTSGQLTASRSSDTYLVSALTNLSGSTAYVFSASIADSYGNISTSGSSFTIAQADTGTMSTNGTFYVIESATNGDNIVLSTNGRTGTQGDLGVSYSPEYNSAAVASFTSSNALISVASNGNLSVGTDISGSGNTDGDTITSNITWIDQFGNAGGPTSITMNIAENFAPTVSPFWVSDNLNTNLAVDGALLAILTWSDTEGDALNTGTFALSGTDASSLSFLYNGANRFGIYAEGDRSAGTISYTASIKDVHGFSTGTYKDDITIAQADDGTMSANGTLYVIESALAVSPYDKIVINSDGYSGTQASMSVAYSTSYGNPVAQNFTSSSPLVAITSGGLLSAQINISGSVSASGDTITTTIGWEDQYGNTDTADFNISVTTNQAPAVTGDVQQGGNINTNLATANTLLTTLTWTDPEGDDIDDSTFTLSGTNASSFSSSFNGGTSFGIYAAGDLTAGTYNYTAKVQDGPNFNTGSYDDTIIISQAGGGTINSENFYIIESALSGSDITNDTDGIGAQSDVNVTYSPSYGTQAAEQFRTLDSVVVIDTNGNLSVKSDISGSISGGSSITPTIYWLDQYGNEGTGSITIQVTNNDAATAGFVNESVNAPVSQGTKLSTVTISDTEGDSPYLLTLSGTDSSKLVAVPQNAASSSWFINASDASLTAGVTLNYTGSIQDAYGETTTGYNQQIVIGAAASTPALWYLYTSEPGQYASTDEATYLTIYGDTNDDGTTDAGYPFDDLTGGDIGSTSFVSSGYTSYGTDDNTLITSGSILSGSNTSPLIENLNHNNLGFMIVFPSSSDFTLPASMTNALSGTTNDEYVLYADRVGTGALNDNPQTSFVRYFDLDSGTYPNSSATRFGVIFAGNGSSNITYFLMSSSGSAPTSTQ